MRRSPAHPLPRARRWAAPVWSLLLLLAIVPTAAMFAFAADDAGRGSARSAQARRAHAATEHLVDLLEVVFGLTGEQIPTQVLLRTRQFGGDMGLAERLMGFDVAARQAEARSETDLALDALPDPVLARFPTLDRLPGDLWAARTRADADGGAADADIVHLEYQRLTERVMTAVEAQKRALAGDEASRIDPRVRSSVAMLSAVHATYQAAYDQVVALGAVLFEPPTPTLERELAFATADYRRAAARLSGRSEPVIRDRWDDIAGRAEVVELGVAVDRVLADPGWVLSGGVERIGQVFSAAFLRAGLLADLNREAVAAGLAASEAAGEEAEASYRRTVAASVAVGLLTLGFAAGVSLAISRPLGQLARRAGMVTGGELVATPAARRGPAEVRTVARALDDAAVGLRRIEEQAQALAGRRFDDPVLSAAVPGALGESVHASVAQLSSSLREQEVLRESLASQARHDLLTGLPNRAGFLEAADRAVARARRSGHLVGVLFVDLDGFKRANDSHGHQFGDEVLRVTAERLGAVARAGDTVSRLGGDEFVVIAEPVSSIATLVALGERLIAAVSEPIEVGGHSARVGASVGVAVMRDGHQSALDLLAEADQAVYRAKRAGRGRVDVFNDALREEIAERNDVEDALRAAIPGGELELHYQPVVDTVTNALRGFEALVRWNRPGHGLVPPLSFIPVAEASNLVVDLGRWVLEAATTQLVAWSANPELAGAHVSVNISGRHLLNACVVEDVRGALRRSGLEPERLVIEITETMILSDLAVAVAHLRSLRELGVRIALDDFGTGYTSIGQLGNLPIDILKIDRAFVSDLHRRDDRSIVELMVGVAHTLGLGLVAEGVEDLDQLDALQQLECDDIQGFYVARPLPAAEAEAWATATADLHQPG